jgi:hypothetical protein
LPLAFAADQKGILPDHMVAALAQDGAILPAYDFVPGQVQPASLDLRLGEVAYRVRASFLPGPNTTVAERIDELKLHDIALGDGAKAPACRKSAFDVATGCSTPKRCARCTRASASWTTTMPT